MTKSSFALIIENDFCNEAGNELGMTSQRGLVLALCRLLTLRGL